MPPLTELTERLFGSPQFSFLSISLAQSVELESGPVPPGTLRERFFLDGNQSHGSTDGNESRAHNSGAEAILRPSEVDDPGLPTFPPLPVEDSFALFVLGLCLCLNAYPERILLPPTEDQPLGGSRPTPTGSENENGTDNGHEGDGDASESVYERGSDHEDGSGGSTGNGSDCEDDGDEDDNDEDNGEGGGNEDDDEDDESDDCTVGYPSDENSDVEEDYLDNDFIDENVAPHNRNTAKLIFAFKKMKSAALEFSLALNDPSFTSRNKVFAVVEAFLSCLQSCVNQSLLLSEQITCIVRRMSVQMPPRVDWVARLFRYSAPTLEFCRSQLQGASEGLSILEVNLHAGASCWNRAIHSFNTLIDQMKLELNSRMSNSRTSRGRGSGNTHFTYTDISHARVHLQQMADLLREIVARYVRKTARDLRRCKKFRDFYFQMALRTAEPFSPDA